MIKRMLMAGAAVLAGGLAAAPASAQTPYIGEIRIMPYSFCPVDFTRANGGLLSIASNQALYSLIGTQFGGDGINTFAVPDLRGRVIVGEGAGPGLTPRTQGQMLGQEQVTLNINEIPSHSHAVRASSQPPDDHTPAGDTFGSFPPGQNIFYSGTSLDETMNQNMIAPVGGDQAHENIQPSLVLNFCIATNGIYPPRN